MDNWRNSPSCETISAGISVRPISLEEEVESRIKNLESKLSEEKELLDILKSEQKISRALELMMNRNRY